MGRWATSRKLFKRKKLVIILAGALIVIALATALPLTLIQPPYKCTLEDIMNNTKISNVANDIIAQDIALSDSISIFVHFYLKPSDSEVQQLEQLGITVNNWSWTPIHDDPPSGFYLAECKIEDLCKLIDIDFVKRVASAESSTEY